MVVGTKLVVAPTPPCDAGPIAVPVSICVPFGPPVGGNPIRDASPPGTLLIIPATFETPGF